jgi:signal transduction histidine kinase
MAVGSVLIALGALALVALTTLVVNSISFNDYQGTQLQGEVNQVADLLGRAPSDGLTGEPVGGVPPGAFARGRFTLNIWVMSTSGQLAFAPQPELNNDPVYTSDKATITAALQRGLQGHEETGALPGPLLSLFAQRYYAVAPIHLNGDPSQPITGAVALSTLPRQSRAAIFAGRVQSALLLATIAAILLAALLAMLFSRRLTRPLARLTEASGRMAAGDYATRVAVRERAPDEMQRLAHSFNDMAGALESDVAKLRRQEQLRRELVANVSHELATPLTAIQGFTEALLDGVVSDPADRDETARLIAREAARLKRLVGQLQQVARYEDGAETLQRAPVRVQALVAETLAVLAPEIERKGVTVVNTLPDDLPPALADGDRLTEILLNLFDNALRHTPEGGRIEVDGAAVANGNTLRLSIGDTGPGIAPADRERIFERFYRVDASRSTATGGSGLGLAIVRSLLEVHGGTITADERPGGGARFTFTLPIAPA